MLGQRRIWWFHAYFVVVWPLLLLAVLGIITASYVLGEAIAQPAINITLGVFLLGFVVAALGSFVGYYEDTKKLREQDANWIPTWWAWTLAHFVLSPVLVAPVYLYHRWRKVGLE